MTPCIHCARPAMNTLCHACIGLLTQALVRVHDLADDLELEVTRQTVKGTKRESGIRSSGARPLPFNAEASDVLALARDTLASWCAELPASVHVDTRNVRAMAACLHRNVRRCVRLTGVGMLLDEITYLRDAMVRTVDLVPERVYIGQCTHCSAAVQGDRTEDWIEHGCGNALPVAGLLGTTQRDIQESWVSAPEILKYLNSKSMKVTAQDISRWHKSGLVRRHENWYHVGDVLTQARIKGSRKRPKVISG